MVVKCQSSICAVMTPGHLFTDKGTPFKVYKYIRGNEGLRQNCHGYAFGIPYWVEDPFPVYNDEYEITDKSNAEIALLGRPYWWVPYAGNSLHSTVIGQNGSPNRGKHGALPVSLNDKSIYIPRDVSYARRKK